MWEKKFTDIKILDLGNLGPPEFRRYIKGHVEMGEEIKHQQQQEQ